MADRVFVSTERLGWPTQQELGWLWRLLRIEKQTKLVYDDRPDEPTANCHLQREEHEDALCGYEWEGLIRVPGDPAFTDVDAHLRCEICADEFDRIANDR